MIEFENTLLVITANMAGSSLPGRPMLDVNGKPLVIRAIEGGEAAKLGKVLVATGAHKVAETVRAAGGVGLVAGGLKSSPAELAAEVLKLRDPHRQFTYILVYPSELAAIPALDLSRCLAGLTNKDIDLATLAAPEGPGRIKVVAPLSAEREVAYLRDLVPLGEGEDAYRHVPVIAWTREALEKCAALPPSSREAVVGSEILRALDASLRCAAVKVDSAPLTVDTAADLDKIRRLLKA